MDRARITWIAEGLSAGPVRILDSARQCSVSALEESCRSKSRSAYAAEEMSNEDDKLSQRRILVTAVDVLE